MKPLKLRMPAANPQKTVPFGVLARVLALCILCPAAFSQSFQTGINGQVLVCNSKTYALTGKAKISDKASESCAAGTADASSSASLDQGLNALGNAAAAGGTGATPKFAGSSASAVQTATLRPPKGFTGTTVSVSFTDPYAATITGLGGSGPTAAAGVCWVLPTLSFTQCHEISSNGISKGVEKIAFKVKKSNSGFRLTILKAATVDIKSTPGSSITAGAASTSYPKLVLPKGWKCSYDSGSACP